MSIKNMFIKNCVPIPIRGIPPVKLCYNLCVRSPKYISKIKPSYLISKVQSFDFIINFKYVKNIYKIAYCILYLIKNVLWMLLLRNLFLTFSHSLCPFILIFPFFPLTFFMNKKCKLMTNVFQLQWKEKL